MAFVRQHPEYPKFRMKVGNIPGLSDLILADPNDPNVYQADQETPFENPNGVRKEFTLANVPFKFSEKIFKDGMMMARATSMALTDGDYFINYDNIYLNKVITFSDQQIPQLASVIRVSYKYKRTV